MSGNIPHINIMLSRAKKCAAGLASQGIRERPDFQILVHPSPLSLNPKLSPHIPTFPRKTNKARYLIPTLPNKTTSLQRAIPTENQNNQFPTNLVGI